MILLADSPGFLSLSAPFWALILSGVALIFALRRWRYIQKQKVKRVSAFPVRPEEISAAAGSALSPKPLNMRDVGVQIQALLVDVEETARRAAAQVDNRYMKLEVLLAEADAKIKRLEELSRRAEGTPEAADARSAAGRLRETLAASRPQPAGPDSASEPVYQLADAGMAIRDIAQKLGKQPGEIELILALRASGQR